MNMNMNMNMNMRKRSAEKNDGRFLKILNIVDFPEEIQNILDQISSRKNSLNLDKRMKLKNINFYQRAAAKPHSLRR